MIPSVACIIIASAHRREQVMRDIVPGVWAQDFDDVVLVGDWPAERHAAIAYRYFCVEPLRHDTIDALVKRDVGTLATTADILVYLCDDHRLRLGFRRAIADVAREPWDVIVPNRFTRAREGAPLVSLNNGERDGYCGGHGGVYRRDVITRKPWSAHAHHRNWDAIISREQMGRGARFTFSPRDDLSIIDLNPSDPQHGLSL